MKYYLHDGAGSFFKFLAFLSVNKQCNFKHFVKYRQMLTQMLTYNVESQQKDILNTFLNCFLVFYSASYGHF